MEFKYLDSAKQAELENRVAALCNRYLPEIVAKFNAFDGKILKVDGRKTKECEAAFPYWYAQADLKRGEYIRLDFSWMEYSKTAYVSAEFSVSEYEDSVTLESRKIRYPVGEVKDGYHNDERTGWKANNHDGRKERTDWTAREIDALKDEYEKAKSALDDAKDKARHFVS